MSSKTPRTVTRRSGRQRQSRFFTVDGENVLKLNNYSLEAGEPSVWMEECVSCARARVGGA